MGAFHNPIGGRSEKEMVQTRMPRMADHDEIAPRLSCAPSEYLGGVSRRYLGGELDPPLSRQPAGFRVYRPEIGVLESVLILHLTDRRRVGRQMFLHRDHVNLGAGEGREVERATERVPCRLGSIESHQHFPKHVSSRARQLLCNTSFSNYRHAIWHPSSFAPDDR